QGFFAQLQQCLVATAHPRCLSSCKDQYRNVLALWHRLVVGGHQLPQVGSHGDPFARTRLKSKHPAAELSNKKPGEQARRVENCNRLMNQVSLFAASTSFLTSPRPPIFAFQVSKGA